MQQTIYLHRIRSFGEKVNDTFLFLKQNWQKLFGIYAVFVVPFIIVAGIAGVVFADRLYAASLSNTELFRFSDIFNLDFFVIVFCFLLASVSYGTAVFSYIRLYEEQRGTQPVITAVGQLYFRKLLRILLYDIVISFILILVFIIPYLVVTFIPLVGIFGQFFLGVLAGAILLHLNIIYIKENLGLFDGVGRLFALFRESWWKTIGFSSIMYLIYYVFSIALFFIIGIIGVLIYTNFLLHHDRGVGIGKGTINLITIGFGIFFLVQQVFYLILFCAVGVSYFSLAEEKDGSAIEEQIESIGTSTDKYGGIEEQY